MKQSFSVKAILRKDKKRINGTCPIYYQVIVDSKPSKLPSGQYLLESEWNFEKNLEKGSKSSHLNCMIRKDISRIEDFLIEKRSLGKVITFDNVKGFYNNRNSDDIYEFFDYFCELKFGEFSEGTQYHYLLLKRRLKEYKPNLRFSQIDLNFVEKFDYFLRIDKKVGIEGVGTMHKKMSAVLRSAFKKKLIGFNPYEDFKILKGKPKSVSLTIEEVVALRKLDLNKIEDKGLLITRDLFLFGSYTGLRCSDISNLKSKNIIGDDLISTTMAKTKHNVEIPIFKKAKDLIEKYRIDGVDKCFPLRTNQCLNRDLKTIAKLCKIDKNITFHMSRHTFGTIIANSGLSLFDVSRLLGHRNVNQSMTYVNTGMNLIVSKLREVEVFN